MNNTIKRFTTTLAFPERGPWGRSNYPGNCSGYIQKTIIERYKPKVFMDIMEGGGTSRDVCNDLGVNYVGYDLKKGFDAVTMNPEQGADIIFIHWPYLNIIKYSNHQNDLSNMSLSDWIKATYDIQVKAVAAINKGGYLVMLIGDVRKNGVFYPLQRLMPWVGKSQQEYIKQQFNCTSDRIHYNVSSNFTYIDHEYLIVTRKEDAYLIPVIKSYLVQIDLRKQKNITWRDVVSAALYNLGAKATLERIYKEIEGHIKTKNNPNWKAKVRQILRIHKDFIWYKNATYGLVS